MNSQAKQGTLMTVTTDNPTHTTSQAPTEAPSVELRLPALRVRQSPTRDLYCFAVDGKRLPDFTTISRVSRDDDATIQGYQRPEVLRHINEIKHYIESEGAMVPNALVIAFDDQVRFEESAGDHQVDYSTPGTLVIPIDLTAPEHGRPGWIVDGQQRTAAIRDARVESFPVSVVAFIANSDAEQRAQFILVNATKPLSKSLIYELLPAVEGELPAQLQRRQLPSRLVARLNYDEDSSLAGLINTPTTPDGVMKDNSMLRMLENSITDGALYRFRDPETGDGDVELMLSVLKPFWAAVELTFPGAWGLPARKSRLMHGAGVVGLGFLMDAIADQILDDRLPQIDDYLRQLKLIAPLCHWTSGTWKFGPELHRKWNDLQNTPRDTQLLTSYLLFEYRRMTRE
jgi:DGQHR domain-containing protein